MIKRPMILIIGLYLALSLYGINGDLLCPRAATEVEQVKLALKFSTGDFNPHYFLHLPFFAYFLFFIYGVLFLAGKAVGVFGSVSDYERLYFTDPSFFYIAARSVVLVLGVLAIIIFYNTAKRLFGKQAALLSALLAACSPVIVRLSHYAAPDMPMFFLAIVSIYFAVNIFKKGRLKDYIFAGLFMGLALSIKHGAAFLAMPIFMSHILSSHDKGLREKLFNKKFAALVIFVLIALFIGTPYAFLDYKNFAAQFSEQSIRMNDANYNFASWKTDKPGWLYIITDTIPFGLGGIVPTIFVLAGVLYAAIKRKKEDYILLSMIVFSYLLVMRWSVIKPRYFIFVFPFMLLLSARFLLESAARICSSMRVRTFVITAVTIIVLVQPLLSDISFDSKVSNKPASILAKVWIEANVPDKASIATFVGVPLVPNDISINRSLDIIKQKKMGKGVMLKRLLKHLSRYPKTYNIYELPYPWRADYDASDFDFKSLTGKGVNFFLITEEAEEYFADPVKYKVQVSYIESVRKECELVKEFRQPRPRIEPGYISDEEYVSIYYLDGAIK